MINNEPISFHELKGNLKNVKERGNHIEALCPCHDDHHRSLSATEKDGRILIFCHAGCAFEDICSALGITPAQLYLENVSKGRLMYQMEQNYDYDDENGELLFQVVRSKRKRFYNRRPCPDNGWENNLEGVRRVLYRLSKLAKLSKASPESPPTVHIVEGEKDVETLEQVGLTATCNPHGAGKWRDEYSDSLTGMNCVILPDNDESGHKHAAMVAKSIYGKVKTVKILNLPGLAHKEDVSDWLANGHTVEELNELVSKTPNWTPHKSDAPVSQRSGFTFTEIDKLLDEPDEEIAFLLDNAATRRVFDLHSQAQGRQEHDRT